MRNKVVSAMLALSVIAGMSAPMTTYAAVDGTIDATGSSTSRVVVGGVDSTFSVTIPKNIVGSGTSGVLDYNVSVSGDIGSTECVSVVPDESVILTQNHKDSKIADIVQYKTDWGCDEFDAVGNGLITYSDLSAGDWNGTFNFNIGLQHNYNTFTLTSDNYDMLGIKRTGDVVIPSSFEKDGITYKVTGLGYGAFKDCAGLTSVSIPNSVRSIDYGAFKGCTGLTNVIIPNSVTRMDNEVFSGCTSLKSVTLSDGLTAIGNDVFFGCSSLQNVSMPCRLVSIGNSVFYNCNSLTNIDIPDSVASIGGSAFRGCSSLSNVVLPSNLTTVGTNTFRGCSSLTSIDIPSGVTAISVSMFEACTGLTSITLPNSIISIGYGAFYGCSALSDIVVPDSVTTIDNYAFSSVQHITYNGTATGSPWGAKSIN